jgi:MarR family transcriptional regulator for hemolysin
MEPKPPADSSTVLEPVGRQLVFTAKAMREAFEDALAEAGGSLGSWVILNAVADVGSVSQSALANHVHLEGATITHHVDRLEAAGLVRRVLDPADRRVRRLELTEAGAELRERMLEAAIRLQTVVMAGLEPGEKAALVRCLEVIQANLAALGVTPSPERLP